MTAPSATAASMLVLVLLLLLPEAEATRSQATRRCTAISLLSSRMEQGQQVSELAVSEHCTCHNLTLMVRLDADGFPVDCAAGGTPSWHLTHVTVPVEAGRARLRTVVAGCFQARGACQCSGRRPCAVVRGQWSLDGLDLRSWNLVIAVVQLPGRPLSLDAHAQPRGDPAGTSATVRYFPRLELRLYRCRGDAGGCDRRERQAVRAVDAWPDASAVFGGDTGAGLPPGLYQLEVRPAASWVCQGNNNGCRTLVTHVRLVNLGEEHKAATFGPSGVGGDRFKALCAVVGVTLALAAAGMMFVWRGCAVAARSGRGGDLIATKLAAPPAANVLLVHIWPTAPAARLMSELRAAGLCVVDCHERRLAALFQALPVTDVLATERLRHARLVVACSERAAALERCQTPRGSRELRFANIVRWLRNSSLASDYRRVFVVLGEDVDAGMEALVPGCRFRWPADVGELVRQISATEERDSCSEEGEQSM